MVKNAAQKKVVKDYAQKNDVPYMEAKNKVANGTNELTSIVLIVDRSGSMGSIAPTVEDALKEFVNAQKELPGELTFDAVFFDDQYEERFSFVNPKLEDLDLTVQPRGMTAMYDAIGKKINSFNEKLSLIEKKYRPSKVLVVIATDGMENASKEFNQKSVAALIKNQQVAGWEFTFIGANQDAVLTAKSLNIAAESAITFAANDKGTENVLRSMNTYASSVRLGNVASYSAADRSAAMEEDN